MIVRDTNGEFLNIACDNCEAPAPSVSAPNINNGLQGLGWHCSGGTHYCPKCLEDVAR